MKKFIFYILIIFTFYSCKALKYTSNTKIKDNIEFEREFNYAFTEATRLALLGNINQAERLYKQCISIYPSAAAYFQLGNIAFQNKKYGEAVYYSKQAIKLDSSIIWYYEQLAKIYKFANLSDSLIKVLKYITNRFPDNYEYKVSLGDLYYKQKDYLNSGKLVSELLKIFPTDKDLIAIRIDCYTRLKQYDSAYILLKSIYENTQNPELINNLARIASLSSYKNEAELFFNNYFNEKKDSLFAVTNYITFLINANFFDKAKEIIQQYVCNDTLSDHFRYQVMVYSMENDSFIKANKSFFLNVFTCFDSIKVIDDTIISLKADFYDVIDSISIANIYIEKLLKTKNNDYFLWNKLIENYIKINNTDSIYSKTKAALTLFNDKLELYYYFGIAAMRLQKYEDAVIAFNTLLKNTDNNKIRVDFMIYLSEAYYNLGNYLKSFELFEAILQLQPDNAVIMNNYAYYLALQNENLYKAKKLSKKSLKIDPDNIAYLDTYGWILFNLNKEKRAKKYIEKAIILGGNNDSDILDHYGDILVKQKKYKEAVKIWEIAYKISNNQLFIEKINKIKLLIK